MLLFTHFVCKSMEIIIVSFIFVEQQHSCTCILYMANSFSMNLGHGMEILFLIKAQDSFKIRTNHNPCVPNLISITK